MIVHKGRWIYWHHENEDGSLGSRAVIKIYCGAEGTSYRYQWRAVTCPECQKIRPGMVEKPVPLKPLKYRALLARAEALQREVEILKSQLGTVQAAHARATEAWVLAEERCDAALKKAMAAVLPNGPPLGPQYP